MLSMEEVEGKIMEFVREKSQVPEPYTPQMRFLDDLGLDSVDLTELVFLLEDLLGAPIEDSELMQLHTIQNALDFLEAKRGVAP